jgi:hypothetical protein
MSPLIQVVITHQSPNGIATRGGAHSCAIISFATSLASLIHDASFRVTVGTMRFVISCNKQLFLPSVVLMNDSLQLDGDRLPVLEDNVMKQVPCAR